MRNKDRYKEVKKQCKTNKAVWYERQPAEAEAASRKSDFTTLYRIVNQLSGNSGHSSKNAMSVKNKSG